MLEFNKNNGALASYKLKGTEQIFSPLLPSFSRPLTDNDDRCWKKESGIQQWYDAEFVLTDMEVQKISESMVQVKSSYSYLKDSAKVEVIYQVNGNGVLKVNYSLDADSDLPRYAKSWYDLRNKRRLS